MNETTSDPNEFNSDEWLNTLTHFLGFLLAVAACRCSSPWRRSWARRVSS